VLEERVFTLAEARAAGVTSEQLRSKQWRRIAYGIYAPTTMPDDPLALLSAIARRLPPAAAFSGGSAAWLDGVDVPPCQPIDVTIPPECGVSAVAGVRVRRAALAAGEVVVRRGLRVTIIERTLADLAWRLPLVDAVVVTDMALHTGRVTVPRLQDWIAGHRGVKGIRFLRCVTELAEPAAESPMESRLRLLLVRGGLPPPEAQVNLYDRDGRFLGRTDLYYRGPNLAIEYDGETHRERRLADNRRQNAILAAGINLLRFSAADVYGPPFVVVAQVRRFFASAGIPVP
jgi:hypothetical protein